MYHLFAGKADYPCGGMNDYVGQFQLLNSAKSSIPNGSDWAQIAKVTEDGLQMLYTWGHNSIYGLGKENPVWKSFNPRQEQS